MAMPARLERTPLNVVAPVAVVLATFWVTLKVLDYLATLADPNADLIELTESTYGMNCQGSVGPGGRVNKVQAGNANAAISKNCAEARESCAFRVDVNQIGDTAPGCGKDLSISWRCGAEERVHRMYVAAEAHSKYISLICPAG